MDWKALAEEQALGQFSQTNLDRAVQALSGFSAVFGEKWVRSRFHPNGQAPSLLWSLLAAWEDWQLVSSLPGADGLVKRWTPGLWEGGVRTEVGVMAKLIRAGFILELEPANGHGGKCDILVRGQECGEFYVEVSRRDIGELGEKTHERMKRLVEAGMQLDSPIETQIGLLREMSDEEFTQFLAWVKSIPGPVSTFADVGLFAQEVCEPGRLHPLLDQQVPEPRKFMVQFHSKPGRIRSVRVLAHITDEKIHKLLSDEASQLPKGKPGALVVEVSSFTGGPTAAAKVVERWFQRRLYSRVKAVALVASSVGAQGVEMRGCTIPNPYSQPDPPLSSALATLYDTTK